MRKHLLLPRRKPGNLEGLDLFHPFCYHNKMHGPDETKGGSKKLPQVAIVGLCHSP